MTNIAKPVRKYKYDKAKTPLRNARESRGLTVQEVALACGTDQGALSKIEREKQLCNLALAESLAKFFKNEALTETHILYPRRFMNKAA